MCHGGCENLKSPLSLSIKRGQVAGQRAGGQVAVGAWRRARGLAQALLPTLCPLTPVPTLPTPFHPLDTTSH